MAAPPSSMQSLNHVLIVFEKVRAIQTAFRSARARSNHRRPAAYAELCSTTLVVQTPSSATDKAILKRPGFPTM